MKGDGGALAFEFEGYECGLQAQVKSADQDQDSGIRRRRGGRSCSSLKTIIESVAMARKRKSADEDQDGGINLPAANGLRLG